MPFWAEIILVCVLGASFGGLLGLLAVIIFG